MDANLITDHDSIVTFYTADASKVTEITDEIVAGDTVRFTGKRQAWIVSAISGDTLYLWTDPHHYRVQHRTRTARRDRVELVRKGNDMDDALAALGI